MNNNIQCSIESSTASINLNSAEDGIYLTPELEGLAGLPEIRTSSGVNAGYDGGWTSAQNYDARLITLRGVIANPDISLVEQKRRQLASVVGQGRKESLTLHFTTEAGRAYTCNVRTISCEMALQRVLTKQDFIIQLRADNPLIYDDSGGSTAGVINVQKELGGFEIDFELPLAIGGGTDISTIVNEGEASNPTIVLNGALHSPTIVNQTTNQQMQILADLEQTPIYSDQISASGNPISFSIDTEYGGKIEELKLNGNAEQTTYSGKNLFTFSNSTHAGHMDIDSTDNSVTMTGTGTGGSSRYMSVTVHVDATKTYNLSGIARKDVKDSGSSHALRVTQLYSDDGTTFLGWNDIYYNTNPTTGTNYSFSGSFSGHEYYRFYIYDDTDSPTATGEKSTYYQMQLEVGNSKTDFEPYTNGPAPNPDYPQDVNVVTGAQNVEVVGKNLFGGLNITSVTYCTASLDGTTLTVTPNDTTHNTAVYLSLGTKIPAGTYTFNSSTFVSNASQLRNAAGSIIHNFGNGYSNKTFTLTETATAITFNWFSTGSTTPFTVDLSTIQIELGNSASSYEPYQGQSYVIPFGDTYLAAIGDYADELVKVDGTWYIRRAIGKKVFTGVAGEAWGVSYTGTPNWIYYISLPNQCATVGDRIMSNLGVQADIGASDTNQGVLCVSGGLLRVRLGTEKSIADWKTWLSTHNMVVYYALATPTDTAITEQTLIDQLNAVASAQLYSGQNNIMNVAFSPNLAGELEIGYVEMEGYDRDQIIIDSQNQTVTMNGENIYDKIADGSEFITMASGDNKMFLTSEVTSDTGYAEVKFKQGFISI